MLFEKNIPDHKYIEKIEKKYSRSKLKKFFIWSDEIFGIAFLILLSFLHYWSMIIIRESIPKEDLLIFAFSFSITGLCFMGFVYLCVVKLVKRIFGDKTELLLLKYYKLSNSIEP